MSLTLKFTVLTPSGSASGSTRLTLPDREQGRPEDGDALPLPPSGAVRWTTERWVSLFLEKTSESVSGASNLQFGLETPLSGDFRIYGRIANGTVEPVRPGSNTGFTDLTGGSLLSITSGSLVSGAAGFSSDAYVVLTLEVTPGTATGSKSWRWKALWDET